ncbi:MAG: hypothetical protein U5K43_07625 [Halofilum sp. (in: g-proteobacteria)]|nr:hypothetical protein [Halofilum sp. (in: g-proteobacteria)]
MNHGARAGTGLGRERRARAVALDPGRGLQQLDAGGVSGERQQQQRRGEQVSSRGHGRCPSPQ